MKTTETWLSQASRYLYPNYGARSIVLDRGEGSTLWDTEGRRYIDFYAGIAVSTLGHAHPRLVAAIAAQAGKLIHQSNHYLSVPNVELAVRLCELTGMDRAFFCNSGTEANEAALKLSRRHFFDQGQVERFRVISFDNSFHGRTLGSLSVTGQPKYTTGFGPSGGSTKVPFGDLEATRNALGPDVAAIITEPIQGEGGVCMPPHGFLEGLRALCDESGALLIFDEIQTGIGRTGHFLYSQALGVKPDILSVAKGLGGGVPIGAMLCTQRLSAGLPPGSHGTTFGGNPLASAAALATLSVLDEENLLSRAQVMGDQLARGLEALTEKHSAASHHRGAGLLRALLLAEGIPPGEVLNRAREAGLLMIPGGSGGLRLAPALTIREQELEEGLTILDQVLGEFSS